MSRFDETIKTMQDITSEIKKAADDRVVGLDIDMTTKVRTVASKTIDVINEAAVKLQEAIKNIEDEAELYSFLDRVEHKCQEAKKYAFDKFDEVARGEVDVDSVECVKIDEKTESVINKDPVFETKEEPVEEKTEEPVYDPEIEAVLDETDDDTSKLEDVVNFVSTVKDNVVDYISSPEAKQLVSKAKLAALNAADKGLDLLIKVLDGKKKDNKEE